VQFDFKCLERLGRVSAAISRKNIASMSALLQWTDNLRADTVERTVWADSKMKREVSN
jgi:hypothetical protein